MTNEFENIPVEEDTRVLSRNFLEMAGFEVCHEVWCYEGITAESIIFREDDVSGKSDDEIKELVAANRKVADPASMTFKRTGEFVFCNFNFIPSDD